ncbi:hypothetical protein KUCAC02_015779 [Chaenocephalus aceratus]|uniref:Uncharacterized protein n=1 Tax=Chaenocephalus aceratus TaxID=36190 RepID=A0ACB9XYB8_CHAAC|nr:hypothetical protein KUCAC02_015779 [Chaenocephalus aceratus]
MCDGHGSNFVKAFKEHQQRQVESDEVDGNGEADFTDLHSVLAATKDDNARSSHGKNLSNENWPISNDHWAA